MQTTTYPKVLSASTLASNKVINPRGETLGNIKDIMLDMAHGRVAYAVLSFGGFLGMGDKLFAIPWGALRLDREQKAFVLDADAERLEQADGFDKDKWPDFAQQSFHTQTHDFWGQKHYWAS